MEYKNLLSVGMIPDRGTVLGRGDPIDRLRQLEVDEETKMTLSSMHAWIANVVSIIEADKYLTRNMDWFEANANDVD